MPPKEAPESIVCIKMSGVFPPEMESDDGKAILAIWPVIEEWGARLELSFAERSYRVLHVQASDPNWLGLLRQGAKDSQADLVFNSRSPEIFDHEALKKQLNLLNQ